VRELTDRIGMAVINSDVVRKQMTAKPGRGVPFNRGMYSAAMTEKTYRKMLGEADQRIAQSQSVILDATFAQRRYRDKVIRLADRHQVPVYFLHCVASDGLTKKRLRDRAMNPNEVSDARWEIYLEQKALEEPLNEFSTSSCLELVTDKSVEHLRQMSEEFLRAGLARRAVTNPG
jgi:predicted kinase